LFEITWNKLGFVVKRSTTKRKPHQFKRQAILVLGMHRSGTSALSGVACALGASPPASPLPANFANPSGYWESWPLVQAHDELLASADSSWDDWRELDPRWYVSDAAQRSRVRLQETIGSEYDQKPLFVVKDPRICRFLPFFLSVLKEMSVAPVALFPIRNPLEVAFSLRRRDGFSISKSVALWLRHVLDAEYHSRRIPRYFISYENLLKDWRLEMGRASDALGVKWPIDPGNSATSVEKFLTAELRHERTEAAGFEKHPDLLFLAAETFHLLREASSAAADRELFAKIDAVREKFDEASKFFGAILRNEERSVQQLRATLDQKSSELEGQRRSVEEQKNQQQALLLEEHKKFRQASVEEQKKFQQASIEQQEKYQSALIAEQTKYQQTLAEERNKLQQALKEMEEKHQQTLAEERNKLQQALKEMEEKHQQALEEQRACQMALIAERDKQQQVLEDQRANQMALIAEREKQQQALAEQHNRHEQALKEAQDKHHQALKEAQDKHQQALDEQNKYRLALIAEQERSQQASAEERSRHEKALTDAQNGYQRELRQKERERNEYVARLSTLSAQFTELNNRIERNDSRLNLMIKELTDALDSKRSEHAKALADLQSSKKVLDEMRGALAASRDVSERQANKLKELQADARRRETTIDDLSREIDVRKRLLADCDQQNQALNSEIDAHRNQAATLHGLLVDHDQQIQALMAEIQALYASRSWRITRPFRVVMRFFSKA
jgi:hypothetical protein